MKVWVSTSFLKGTAIIFYQGSIYSVYSLRSDMKIYQGNKRLRLGRYRLKWICDYRILCYNFSASSKFPSILERSSKEVKLGILSKIPHYFWFLDEKVDYL